MSALDLVDLRIFEELIKTRNVSRAAEAVGLGQPAISMRLSRLRRHFDDPLFVRTSSGMEPTPRALALAEPVRQALGILRQGLEQGRASHAAKSSLPVTKIESRQHIVKITLTDQRVLSGIRTTPAPSPWRAG